MSVTNDQALADIAELLNIAPAELDAELDLRDQGVDERPGTNPEELLAAAHAGCFNMALAFGLSAAGRPPEELRTKAEVKIESEGAGFAIKTIALTLRGKVPGISAEEFRKAAEDAKAGCPVSKLFKGAEITLDAQLAS